jgi:hypothetical protein
MGKGKSQKFEDGEFCPINAHPQSDGMCKKVKCQWWAGGHGCIVHVLARALCDIRDRTSI